ncbi:MAG: ABC transporter substrate-binding protein [bacterium]
MNSKKLIVLFICANLLHGQFSCSKKRNDTPAKPFRGTLTIGEFTRPQTLNPVLEVTGVSAHLVNLIFDSLVRIGEKGEILPHLAVSWEMKGGGREWVFYLRKGVRFHDGRQLSADDVKFTLDLVRDPALGSGYARSLSQIAKVEVRDSYTIGISLTEPSVSLPHEINIGILPRHLLEGENIRASSFNYHPVGTGPFQFVRWSRDEVEFAANLNYFLGRPYLDHVVVKSFKNQYLVSANLMRGEIDAFPFLASSSYEVIKKIPSFRVYPTLRPFYYLIAFNLSNPLFQDRRVRQALNYAIDKESIIKRVLKGRGIAASGTIFPSSWAFDDRVEPFPYDPCKAMELLKEAGWQDSDGDHVLDKNNQPLAFQIYLPDGYDELESSSFMIMEQLASVGVMTRGEKFPVEIFNREHLLTRKFEAVFMFANAGGDPDSSYQFWHSSSARGGFNFFSYHNPGIDQLLDQGRSTRDQKERKRIYSRYQEEIKEDPPGIFLFWKENLLCVHKRFCGIHVSAFYGVFNSIREWYICPDDERKHD